MNIRSRQGWVRDNLTNILRVVIVPFFLVLAVAAITLNHLDHVIANQEPGLWLTTALVSVGPELAGIVIGIVTIDYLNERRQREQLKAQLIRQMGSNIRDVAVPATRELAHHGWLTDDTLSGHNFQEAALIRAKLSGAKLSYAKLSGGKLSRADLRWAELSGASLIKADLRRADLRWAELSGASLNEADLRWVDLRSADLRWAYLIKANLTEANLREAKLRGCDLIGADLIDADLGDADLSDANLTGAKSFTIRQLERARSLEGAIMPDGIQLGTEETPDGLTFEEWKAGYLARHGSAATDARDER